MIWTRLHPYELKPSWSFPLLTAHPWFGRVRPSPNQRSAERLDVEMLTKESQLAQVGAIQSSPKGTVHAIATISTVRPSMVWMLWVLHFRCSKPKPSERQMLCTPANTSHTGYSCGHSIISASRPEPTILLTMAIFGQPRARTHPGQW